MRRRSSLDSVRESLRMQQIYNVFMQYGMDILLDRGVIGEFRRYMQEKLYDPPHPLHQVTTPVKVRLLLQELGPTYVKMGQIVSSQSQVLPEEWAVEMTKLQSDVPPFDYDIVRETIISELGGPPEEVFAEFNPVPFAAASTAQVHNAFLHSGEEVVVKVQRPDIKRQVKADLGIMASAARVVERRQDWAREYGLVSVLNEFGTNVIYELDYRNEAYNALRLGRNMESIEKVEVPKVYSLYSTERVLTMSLVRGVKLTNLDEIDAAGLDRHELATVIVTALIKQLLIDGFFHGDPHPGNLFVNLETGVVTFLDNGMMGELDFQKRLNLAQMLMVVRDRDTMGMAQVLLSLSQPFRPNTNEKAYYREFERVVSRYMDPPDDSTPASFADAANAGLELLRTHGYRLDPELTLALKAMMQIEAITKLLYSETGISVIGFQLARNMLIESVTAEKVADVLQQQATMTLREVVQRLPSLQEATLSWIDQYQKGKFVLHIDTAEISKEVKKFNAMTVQITIGIVLLGMIVGSAIAASFISVSGEYGSLLAAVAFGGYFLAMFIATILVLNLVIRAMRGNRDKYY